MSIATFESPQAATQRFFPWVNAADTDCDLSKSASAAQEVRAEANVYKGRAAIVGEPSRQSGNLSPNLAGNFANFQAGGSTTECRLAAPVRIGAVMLKLLKGYGISDEEIAAGIAAYAATAGLAQAG